MTLATASLSLKVVDKAVKSALQKVNISNILSLIQSQTRSLFSFFFFSDIDTFFSLPAGQGKSLIYQICPGRLFTASLFTYATEKESEGNGKSMETQWAASRFFDSLSQSSFPLVKSYFY